MSSIDHYENFPVASWLCPARLRPAVAALYHFARTADDLADEGNEPAHHRLDALGEYRADLQNCLSQANIESVRWPHVFGPLRLAAHQCQLPAQPLFDLLDAFEQDVVYTSVGQGYRNRAELLDYCRRSANPVGRLMLHLYGVNDATSLAQSDAICTALQLINFWQDIADDLRRGRDYLPEGHTLSEELHFARELMLQGAPLVHRVKGRAGWELRAVVQGGLRILDKLDTRGETSHHTQLARPTLHKPDFIRIAWRCIRM
ncbi:MAG: squalene synthase HpnC [Burkholderiales bacterium 35-55-47]|jgi:squalene synthase HpnC|uniref:squalene/phytoene synthase family protein n=1 Tax=Limnohabitans sp. TaxID=1907725 RepID=UPI000BD1ED26|nr:squalene/phytoene synthase family protein [Limnohabitans sp.]OYY17552.1 MAG: squalene synthase HpnC [Burkholderiales bacterium 35-55-47]OYZ72383.1 MAG: squalene synthase HpnC [Burkholderiales bacterium 24-55-52]OZA99874.1 MAG: squalene synthase HpnC [Burkholderiales bacterium 39-55-53]HQR85125.1 squalene/phytoene synthase family protein [Limnohabitans sp.]HQS27466.1 squalene/phytoene synthase family protein [Limnohabitans sp.]